MIKIYNCIATQHDLRLVGLAALICALAAFSAVSLLHHVGRSERIMRRAWLVIAAIATGFGIWATHFIAMLAFQPTVPSGYDIALTIVSLVIAIGLTGTGFAIGTSRHMPSGRWIGGCVVGAGVAAMHYTGMAAFETAGRIDWHVPLVAASIALAAVIGAATLPVALRANTIKWKTLGALLLTVTICSHHFTAMGAVTIVLDPLLVVSATALPASSMAIGVALVSAAIILLALAGLAVDLRDSRIAVETARMRDLADAAVEGLVVCNGVEIVAANRSFTALACANGSEAIGRPLTSFFPALALSEIADRTNQVTEAALRTADGGAVPVEVIQRTIVLGGRPHRALAVRDLRERKKAEEDINFLAHHDPLTRLPNRLAFNKRLDAELAAHRGTDRCFAVLFVDLDRFKEINDLFGHPTGDAVLQYVADRIRGALQSEQLVARLGGDEFAVLLPRLGGPAEAARTAEAILEAFQDEGQGLPPGVNVGTSIGIAVFPDDATDRVALLSHADAALYEAKAQGRGVYRLFQASMGAHLRDRRQLQHDLRHAIARDELSLVYQLQAGLQCNEVLGLEALLRWHHATRGAIPPAEFIPLAEECGAILQIGEWVLRTACAEAARWQRPLTVSVNVSAVQLHDSNLPKLVGDVLDATGLAPSRLELEITESALIKDIGRTLAVLRKLKQLGVRIAMDDFGTGYSSLSNLRAFPFDKIKVDQSFVRSVDTSGEAAAIVRAVVGLARGLKLPVLAEGVETDAERDFLRQEGCDAMQGYLLGRPRPIAELEQHTSEQPNEATRRPRNSELRLVRPEFA